jgi:antitoxin MazE
MEDGIMLKHLFKYGNSLALIIDKPILELLNIQEDTILKVTTDGTTIIITPVQAKKTSGKVSNRKKVQESFEEIMDQYAPALKKLAKN